MATDAEIAAVQRAINLSVYGLGHTSPNPIVGCVVLDAGGITVGEGYHEYPGGPHAEVSALRAAGERAHGGTIAVTLEPCRHAGRTGPCVERIIEAGIRRVVFAVTDPHLEAAGGADALRTAGVEVEVGVLADQAARVNETWLTAVQRRRPYVTWKYAASMDGRVAAADGSSRWITGPDARSDGHRLRAVSDAVLVGSGTVLADDPQLTVRLLGEPDHPQPLRVVVDSQARTPPGARVLDDAAPTLVAVANDANDTATGRLEACAGVVRLPRGETGLDLRALLDELYQRGVVSVLTEGGPTLAAALLAGDYIDAAVGYIAPALIGGQGVPALAGPGASSIDAAHRMRLDEVIRVGGDVRLTARRKDA